MADSALRREVVHFVWGSYTEYGIISTVRDVLSCFGISRDVFYDAFPGGMRQACQEAGVPIPEERYRAVARACAARRKTARGSSRRGIGSDAADIDLGKVRETDMRNLSPMGDLTTAPSPVMVPANTTTVQEPTDWMRWPSEVHGPAIPLRLEPDPSLIACVSNATNGQILWWKNLTPEYVRHLLDYLPDAT
jgi:hypothetical protein